MNKIDIRFAKLYEAESIEALIGKYASKGLMLPRSKEFIISEIRNYVVAIYENRVIGVCGFAFFTEKIAEIRSLAVEEEYRNKGIGRQLVEFSERILKEEGIEIAFVLTYQVEFFRKLGYEIVEKKRFPQKIWRDCVYCPKIVECDEVAMMKELRN